MKTTFIYLFSLLMITSAANAQSKKDETPAKFAAKASIAGKLKGAITSTELLTSKGIEVTDSTYHVTEFKMHIAGKDFPYREFDGHGSALDYRMRNAINAAPAGTKVNFELIKCINANRETHFTPPFQVVLK